MVAWIELPMTEALLGTIRKTYLAGYEAQADGQIGEDGPAWTGYVARELAKLCPEGCAPYGHQFCDRDLSECFVDHAWGV